MKTRTGRHWAAGWCLLAMLAVAEQGRAQQGAQGSQGAQGAQRAQESQETQGIQRAATPQAAAGRLPRLTRVPHQEAAIDLDGLLNESVWAQVPVVDGMRVIDPDTLAAAPFETHVRVFYTGRGIYVGVKNHQPADTLVARMTSRDTRLPRDGFVVAIDPSGEGLYGFFLRVNLGDSLTDGTILPERRLNMQWDGPWDARTQALADGWSAEYFIPWSMMPLPRAGNEQNGGEVSNGDSENGIATTGGARQIGFYFERQVGHLGGESWSNPPLPRTVNEYISAFQRYELRDVEPRAQITYYPFVSGFYDGIRHEAEFKAGSELFWRPTTDTQLSATLNPDFGNVESDDVVVNLSAFETFFPEKRSFFLEGQDIFNTSPRTSGRGGPGGPIQLLNTRRIGGAPDYDIPDDVDIVATDLSRPTELLGAVKFTGQAGNWRYGTLLAAEDDSEIKGMDEDTGQRVKVTAQGRDFAVARLLYEQTGDGGRRSIGWMGTEVMHDDIDATVNAIDMHYFSADSRWVMDAQLMHSDVDGETGAGFLADFGFRPRRGVNHGLRMTWMDDELQLNETGFLTRNDQANLDYNYFRTESDVPGLRERNTSVFITNQWNTSGRPVRLGLFFNRQYTYLNSNRFDFSVRYFPARVDDRLGGDSGPFRIPGRFGLNIGYETDPAKPVSFGFEFRPGQSELGPARYESAAGVTWHPNDRFSMEFVAQYTDQEALLLHIGDGHYTSYESHRWSSRLETNYFITAKQHLRFSMQWTGLKAFSDRFWQVHPEQVKRLRPVAESHEDSADFTISRLTFQARYRWEIAPLSDLFVVYTRGGNLPRDTFTTFPELFERAWNQPVVDSVAIKLRYRLGS